MITLAEEILLRAAELRDAPAVAGSATLTYDDLAARVAELAAILRRETPGGALVASAVAHAHAGLVAVLAAGIARRALLPLDLGYPQAYRESIVADARPALLLTETPSGEVVAAPARLPDNAGPRVDLDDVAYVMYTSGSTGRPKGVVVSQESLLTRIAAFARTPGLAPHESMLAASALSFDVSLVELLVPPFVGARMISAPAGARRDPSLFDETVERYGPEVVQATPSYFRLALAMGWKGAPASRIWSVGEPLTGALAAELLPRCGELWNLYGPTEATIYASVARVRTADRIVLGTSVPGTALCLAGHRRGTRGTASTTGTPPRRAAPAEPVEGEILIYGTGLADGYLDRPEMTAERFAVMDTPHGPRTCYRTGDLGRLAGDGEIEFLGRLDDQVKIRGHRVELGHVEAVFESHPGVRAAVALVLAPEDPARAQLAVMAAVEESTTVRDLRRWAVDRLPAAMVPERMTLVAALPRTPAGKADRVAVRATFVAAMH